MRRFALVVVSTLFIASLSACGGDNKVEPASTAVERPMAQGGKIRDASRGKLTGEEGWTIFGGKKKDDGTGANIGVNGFLWRATLDTLSFMPITSADPFGGVVITDWYEDPATPGERFKVNAFILDRSLRADGVKIKVFKQAKNGNDWNDVAVSDSMSRSIEDTVLTRARQLRVAQLENK